MCLCSLRLKKQHNFPHTVHYCCSAFLKCVDFYKAHYSEKRLASYPVHCDWPNTSRVWWKCYAPYRIVMLCPGTTTQKQISNIITDYNDLYCLFTRHDATLPCLYLWSGEMTNKMCNSTLLKTHIWIVSGKFFKYENILTSCESEAPDCPCKLGIAPLYRNSLWATSGIVCYFPRFRK